MNFANLALILISLLYIERSKTDAFFSPFRPRIANFLSPHHSNSIDSHKFSGLFTNHATSNSNPGQSTDSKKLLKDAQHLAEDLKKRINELKHKVGLEKDDDD